MLSQSGKCVCIGCDAEKLAFLVLHDVAELFIYKFQKLIYG